MHSTPPSAEQLKLFFWHTTTLWTNRNDFVFFCSSLIHYIKKHCLCERLHYRVSFKESNMRTQQLHRVKQKIQLGWSLLKEDKKAASMCGAFPRLSLSLQPSLWWMELLETDVVSVRLVMCTGISQSLICPALQCSVFCRTHLTPAKLCILSTWIWNSLDTAHPFVPDCSLFSTLIHD